MEVCFVEGRVDRLQILVCPSSTKHACTVRVECEKILHRTFSHICTKYVKKYYVSLCIPHILQWIIIKNCIASWGVYSKTVRGPRGVGAKWNPSGARGGAVGVTRAPRPPLHMPPSVPVARTALALATRPHLRASRPHRDSRSTRRRAGLLGAARVTAALNLVDERCVCCKGRWKAGHNHLLTKF